jgi:hypothetical protein
MNANDYTAANGDSKLNVILTNGLAMSRKRRGSLPFCQTNPMLQQAVTHRRAPFFITPDPGPRETAGV